MMQAPEWILTVTALLCVGFAIGVGPLQLTVRAALRQVVQVPVMRQWQNVATYGIATGVLLSVLLASVIAGSAGAVMTAVLALLLLLAALDLAWRWLPFSWTIPLLVLGCVSAIVSQSLPTALSGAALGAGTLWVLQITFRFLRGIEALGTGDIWLAAGLGALAGPQNITLILGCAALTGLAVEIGRMTLKAGPTRNRLGVAYGAHLILAYIIFIPL